MGLYLDLIDEAGAESELLRPAPSDISDISDIRGVSSLMSLLSPPQEAPRIASDRLTVIGQSALNNPCGWSRQFEIRAAKWQASKQYGRETAERLAWGELQNRWHLVFGDRLPRDICAGCDKAIGVAEALDHIDGTRVHLADGYDCLNRYGERWRGAATRALIAMGLPLPPAAEMYELLRG